MTQLDLIKEAVLSIGFTKGLPKFNRINMVADGKVEVYYPKKQIKKGYIKNNTLYFARSQRKL